MTITTPHDIQIELNLREIEVEALRMALAEADKLMDHCDEPTEWRERWAGLLAGNVQSRHELQYWRPIIRVANVTVDGATCIVPVSDLIDTIGDGGRYEVEVTTMSLTAFEQLPEFAGW